MGKWLTPEGEKEVKKVIDILEAGTGVGNATFHLWRLLEHDKEVIEDGEDR